MTEVGKCVFDPDHGPGVARHDGSVDICDDCWERMEKDRDREAISGVSEVVRDRVADILTKNAPHKGSLVRAIQGEHHAAHALAHLIAYILSGQGAGESAWAAAREWLATVSKEGETLILEHRHRLLAGHEESHLDHAVTRLAMEEYRVR